MIFEKKKNLNLGIVEDIEEPGFITLDAGPDRGIVIAHLGVLLMGVPKKGVVNLRVGVACQELEIPGIELEGQGELAHQLINAVQEQSENGGSLRVFRVFEVSCAELELVAEGNPVFFDEHAEALKSAEVWVEHELGERAELGRAVPAVRTVDQHVLALLLSVSE